MAYTRYDNRLIFRNAEEIYIDYLVSKRLPFIRQYSSPLHRRLTSRQYNDLTVTTTMWMTGDRLWKLAAEHYGSAKYWWVIAYFNNKPTDSHFKIGDTVQVPFPLNTILSYIKST